MRRSSGRSRCSSATLYLRRSDAVDGSCELLYHIQHGQFEKVYLLTYQWFSNVPEHIITVDARRVMPYEGFCHLLAHGDMAFARTQNCEERYGFIALMVEFLKLLAIEKGLFVHNVCNTIDADIIYLGHAFATMHQNKTSMQNIKDAAGFRASKFMNYAVAFCDELQLATPLRWPRSSILLKDIVSELCTDYFDIDNFEFIPCGTHVSFNMVMDSMKAAIEQYLAFKGISFR